MFRLMPFILILLFFVRNDIAVHAKNTISEVAARARRIPSENVPREYFIEYGTNHFYPLIIGGINTLIQKLITQCLSFSKAGNKRI